MELKEAIEEIENILIETLTFKSDVENLMKPIKDMYNERKNYAKTKRTN